MKTYRVYRVYRNSLKCIQQIESGLSLEQAKKLVQAFPDNDDTMVVFTMERAED